MGAFGCDGLPPVWNGLTFEAVVFRGPCGEEDWRAVVSGELQRPVFNCKGAALAFAEAVAKGNRKPEPYDV